MDTVNVSFIGAGNLANAMHYPSLHEFEDVNLVAICDLNPERLHRTADKYGVERRYTDYQQMLKEVDCEAVYVIMPPHHLYDLVITCLEAGKHVFIEKPPGVTSEQTRQMARWAERHHCLSMVGFNRRFIPMLTKAKAEVEARGPLVQGVATFYKHYFAGPYYKGAVDILTSDAIHAVDALRWMGGEPKKVASSVRYLEATYANSFNALLEFENGAVGVLLGNWIVGARVHTFEMHAKGISAFLNPDNKGYIYREGRNEPEIWDTCEVAGSRERHKTYGFFQENRHFIDCVKTGQLPQTHFGDAAKTMELVDLIYAKAF
ncbi:MAG TPA: Gfo/Idh/MocA family oxidoreductase [Armatimonadetes bacterium]|nr:Gfo/Idh/MocA family oxidoreductase [Armatimonadota bacterium]